MAEWVSPFYGSECWRAEAIIAFMAFLKSARLLMAQKASNQTASCAASIIVSVGCKSGFKAAAACDSGPDQPGNRHHRRQRWLGRCVRSCPPKRWRVVARLVPSSIKLRIRSPTQAAFLEFLAAAARAGIVAANPSERIPVGFALGEFSFDLLESPLAIRTALVAEAIPAG
jgi:hypothetical protein